MPTYLFPSLGLTNFGVLGVCNVERSIAIDHLHNYGPGTRFFASQARFGCVVCVSHWSFRFSSAFECRSAITVVFLAFSIEAGLVLHSSLMVFSRSGELRKRWLLAIRQADWSHFRVPNNTVVCIEHVLPAKSFRFHARA